MKNTYEVLKEQWILDMQAFQRSVRVSVSSREELVEEWDSMKPNHRKADVARVRTDLIIANAATAAGRIR